MLSVRRMYIIHLPNNQIIRAWQGHNHETKYFYVEKGDVLVGAVKVNCWENPSPELPVEKFFLSENDPKILFIPPGYANGFKSLTNEAKILVFSDKTLEESNNDIFRYPPEFWNLTK